MHVVLLYLSNVQFCGANKLNELHQKWVKNKEKLLLQPRKIYKKKQLKLFSLLSSKSRISTITSWASQANVYITLYYDVIIRKVLRTFFFAFSLTSENSLLKPQYCLSSLLSVCKHMSPSLYVSLCLPFIRLLFLDSKHFEHSLGGRWQRENFLYPPCTLALFLQQLPMNGAEHSLDFRSTKTFLV